MTATAAAPSLLHAAARRAGRRPHAHRGQLDQAAVHQHRDGWIPLARGRARSGCRGGRCRVPRPAPARLRPATPLVGRHRGEARAVGRCARRAAASDGGGVMAAALGAAAATQYDVRCQRGAGGVWFGARCVGLLKENLD